MTCNGDPSWDFSNGQEGLGKRRNCSIIVNIVCSAMAAPATRSQVRVETNRRRRSIAWDIWTIIIPCSVFCEVGGDKEIILETLA